MFVSPTRKLTIAAVALILSTVLVIFWNLYGRKGAELVDQSHIESVADAEPDNPSTADPERVSEVPAITDDNAASVGTAEKASADDLLKTKYRRERPPFDWRKPPGISGMPNPDPIELAFSTGGSELSSFERKRQKAAPGLEFRRLSLQDENGKIPVDGLQKAKRHMDIMRDSQDAKAKAAGKDPNKVEVAGIEPGGWAWLGPGNVGGRIRSIVFDPNNANNVWVGSVSGGIWRSTNGAASWQPVDDFMANLAVSTMVMHPTNTAMMYAGTGEGYGLSVNPGAGVQGTQGSGIFQTTDSGATWSRLASTDPAPAAGPAPGCGVIGSTPCPNTWLFVNRMTILPDGITILAATGSGTVLSPDGGVTWTQQTNTQAFDIDFDPTNSNLVVVGEVASARFSSDGGQTWTAATFIDTANPGGTTTVTPLSAGNNGRVEIAYAPSNPSIVYAAVNNNNGDLYQSTNGGQTFTRLNTGTNFFLGAGNQGWYDNIVWVNPQDSTFLIVGGIDLWRSTDSGANFARISQWQCAPGQPNACAGTSAHADHHMIVAHPGFNNSTNKTVYFGNDGGIYRADDVSTVTQTSGWTVNLNNNLGITQFYGGAATPGGVIFGGNQDNGTIKVVPTSAFTPPYDPQSWSTIRGGDGGQVAADPTDANYLYGETQNLGLFRSTDGGATASNINAGITDAACTPPPGGTCNPPANFIAPFLLDPNDPNTMLAGGLSLWNCGNVKAAAPTWTIAKCSTAAPNPVNQPISAIAVSPSNSDFIVVGHNDGQIYMTFDGTCISDGSCVAGGACPNAPTWTRIDNISAVPAPARFVTRLAIDNTRSPNWIYATYGSFNNNNVLVTRDFGANWIDVSGATGSATDLPAVPVRSIVINLATADRLYVGTEVGIFASDDAGATWQLPNGGPANVSVDELFWFRGDLVAATHGRGMYKTQVPVIDTSSCIVNVDSGIGCPGTACAPGQIACPGSNCTCCNAGAWQCPCSWNTQKVPTADDDPYVSCRMTGSGAARNITIGPGGGMTFNGSGGLRAFGGDIVNFGFVRVLNPFGGSGITADRHISNFGTIQMPGSISAGGVLSNRGIIAISDEVNAKGLITGSDSSLTFNRMTIEGDVNHSGLAQDNGLATFQSLMNFRSPPGMTSTIAGPGVWSGPRGAILPGSSFRLGSNVTMALSDFRNSGTLDVQANQLTFTGSTFTNDPGQLANGRGVLGTGIVNLAPSTGSATFVTGRREIPQEVEFTPQLRISSGNVIAFGNVSGVAVDAGATMQADIVDVNGDMTVSGTIVPLGGSARLNFNGNTLTNNGAIGSLFFLNFNQSGSPRMQTIQGVGTWSPRNVQLGLNPPSLSTTSLRLENDIRFTNNESFNISQGSTLALGTRTLTLAGPANLFNDGSITGAFGTLRFEASGAGGRIRGINGAVFGSEVEIGSGQVFVHPSSQFITLERDLQVDTGATFTMTGPALVTLRNVLNNGTINILPGTPFAVFEPRGQIFTNNGAISGTNLLFRFGPGAGGPFTHQLNGTGTWGNITQLLVNTGSTLELTSDVTYSGNSIHLLGNLNTLSNTLTLPCTTSWSGPGETFGNIRRTNLAACPGAIGFGNPFTTIQFTSGTPPTELTFSVSPTPPFASAVSRTYLITPFGGGPYTATLRLHYLDSELNGNPESSLQLWRNNGTGWTAQGATNRNETDNWVEYAGVTQFSPWALSQLAPTAAGVSVRGRVSTSSGAGISRAVVRMDDSDGRGRMTITNTFGYFRFDNVTAGESYVVSVSHKRYRFTPRLVDVSNDISGLDFIAEDFPRRFAALRFSPTHDRGVPDP